MKQLAVAAALLAVVLVALLARGTNSAEPPVMVNLTGEAAPSMASSHTMAPQAAGNAPSSSDDQRALSRRQRAWSDGSPGLPALGADRTPNREALSSEAAAYSELAAYSESELEPAEPLREIRRKRISIDLEVAAAKGDTARVAVLRSRLERLRQLHPPDSPAAPVETKP